MLRRCPQCSRDLPASEFYPQRSRRDGLRVYCKTCHRANVRANEKAHPPDARTTRDRNLRKRRGVTLDQFDACLAAQGGVCAICGGPGPFHADHDHASSAFRGVLCQLCNQGLGQFRDNPDLLRRAIDYLTAGGSFNARKSR